MPQVHQSEKVCAATCKVSVCPSSIKSPVGVEPSALLYSKGVCLSFLAARGGRQCAVPCKVLCAVLCRVPCSVPCSWPPRPPLVWPTESRLLTKSGNVWPQHTLRPKYRKWKVNISMRHYSKDLYINPRVTHQNDGFLHLLNSQNIDAKHTDKKEK